MVIRGSTGTGEVSGTVIHGPVEGGAACLLLGARGAPEPGRDDRENEREPSPRKLSP